MDTAFIEIYLYDLTIAIFRHFNRYQKTNRCWKKVNGFWILENRTLIKDWDIADIVEVVDGLRQTITKGGIVYGAFMDNILIGFATVENELFGTNSEYLQLTNIYISNEHRREGAGKRLFCIMCKEAKRMGAKKLYMSADSSEETQAFFKSMNCVEAQEYRTQLAESQPCDCQLEISL